MNIAQHLAATLKTLRQQRGWSLSRLAEETGVSKAMLGQIERNESSPTVATLWKIATGLNVPFSRSSSRTPAPRPPRLIRSSRRCGDASIPVDPELRFDHFSITLAPGALSESTPHEKGVIEHVVVISGTLDLCLQGEWHSLQAGEGRRFAGDATHAYRNRGAQAAHFHSLIHYPKEKTASEPAARQDD